MKLKLIWVTKILDKILNLSIAPPWYTKSYKNINETRWEICRNTWRNESSQYTRCANIVYAPIFFLAVVAWEAPFIRKKNFFFIPLHPSLVARTIYISPKLWTMRLKQCSNLSSVKEWGKDVMGFIFPSNRFYYDDVVKDGISIFVSSTL